MSPTWMHELDTQAEKVNRWCIVTPQHQSTEVGNFATNVPTYEITATLTPLQATIKVTCKILRLLSTLRC